MSDGRKVMVQGRIVWVAGDLFAGKIKTAFGTQTPLLDQQGQQRKEYGFGLAVPKANCAEIWNAMHEEAYTLYPSRQVPPSFAMKFKDGDTAVDDQGRPYSAREGYAGCIVLSLTTEIAIKFFKFENGGNIQIPNGIKCGDYVNVQVHIKAHGAQGAGKAGLYLNPMAVQFIGYGKEIVNAPSGDQIFGTQAPPMVPGASAHPVAPQGNTMLMPSAPPAALAGNAPFQPPPAAPGFQPPAQPAYQPPQQAPAQPHYGVLPPSMQPPQGAPLPPQFPAAPATAQMPPVQTPPMAYSTGAPSSVPPAYHPPEAPAMPGFNPGNGPGAMPATPPAGMAPTMNGQAAPTGAFPFNPGVPQ